MPRENGASPLFEESKFTDGTPTQSINPFRMLHKKDKEQQQQVVGSNLDVKRVKYSFKQTSPGDDKQ